MAFAGIHHWRVSFRFRISFRFAQFAIQFSAVFVESMTRCVHRLRFCHDFSLKRLGVAIFWGKSCVLIPPYVSILECEASVVVCGFYVNEMRFFAATLFFVFS